MKSFITALSILSAVYAHPPSCSELWTYYETCTISGDLNVDTIADVCTGPVCGPLLEEAKSKCGDEADHLAEATDFCDAATCGSLAQAYVSCVGETTQEFCNADCTSAIAQGEVECPDAANLQWAARRCSEGGDACITATEKLVYTCYYTATLEEACTDECIGYIEDVKSKCDVASAEYEIALDNQQSCDNPACGEPYWYVAEHCYDEDDHPTCDGTCTAKLAQMADACFGLLAFDYYAIDFDYCNVIPCDETDADSCPSYMQCDCSSSSRRLLFATPPMCTCALP